MRRASAGLFLAVLLTSGVGLAGCGEKQPAYSATGAWARPTPAVAKNGVVYLTVTSAVRDSLVGVDVSPNIAARAELHTSDAAGGGGHQHGAVGGAEVTMEEVTEVDIEAGSPLEFQPGGNHIMLIDLSRPLELGDSFPATLRFSSGRELAVTVMVADNPRS